MSPRLWNQPQNMQLRSGKAQTLPENENQSHLLANLKASSHRCRAGVATALSLCLHRCHSWVSSAPGHLLRSAIQAQQLLPGIPKFKRKVQAGLVIGRPPCPGRQQTSGLKGKPAERPADRNRVNGWAPVTALPPSLQACKILAHDRNHRRYFRSRNTSA